MPHAKLLTLTPSNTTPPFHSFSLLPLTLDCSANLYTEHASWWRAHEAMRGSRRGAHVGQLTKPGNGHSKAEKGVASRETQRVGREQAVEARERQKRRQTLAAADYDVVAVENDAQGSSALNASGNIRFINAKANVKYTSKKFRQCNYLETVEKGFY